ncbi:P-loop ATPase, Sll1717 family [Sessilibacter corallicola]|uniref:Uncharacterized protein n=1 Tax=Sessilibacter corallicola TaxID=2904075 RepID=A0ABQ0A917_9GAMM
MDNANRLPFGDPDGARALLEDVLDGFVEFENDPVWGGISANPSNRNIRVFVGKKGAGKTVYLRYFQDSTRAENAIFSAGVEEDTPSTEFIRTFSEYFNSESLTESWRLAWRSALLCSLASHLLYKKYFKDYLSDKDRNDLLKFQDLLCSSQYPQSPYSELTRIISSIPDRDHFNTFISRNDWHGFQSILSDLLKKCPPIFFYIDAVDEEFSHAPMEWLRCQKGLFYAVMRLLRVGTSIGGRFHIVIAIRDIVLSSVLQSEHAGRYRNTPHICKLNWNEKSIAHFFNKKIERLSSNYFSNKGEKTLESFLGLKKIVNLNRGISEEPMSYLLRHTRLIPRDIVELGNALAEAKLRKNSGYFTNSDEWEAEVRRCVSICSRRFAEDQLTICGNQIASFDAPQRSGMHRYSEFYTSTEEYIETRSKDLIDAINDIGKDLINNSELSSAEEGIKTAIGESHYDVLSILWQNGMLGYKSPVNEKYYEFYTLSDNDEFLLPRDKDSYVLHSCLLDLCDLRVVTKIPVKQRPF